MRPGARAALALLLSLLTTTGLVAAGAGRPAAAADVDVRVTAETVPVGSGADAAELDTSLYVPSTATSGSPAPAVLLAHGFGGSKDSVAADARDLARRGYVVQTWSARGFGRSTGQIGLDDPRFEVADASVLIDRLGQRDDVRQDGSGDPRVGIAGASYGGALALLAAGTDDRVDAIVPQITWHSLTSAFFPDQAGDAGAGTVAATPATEGAGVFKRLWAGLFFGSGAAPAADGALGALTGGGAAPAAAADLGAEQLTCGRFRPDVCAAYQSAASTGTLTPEVAAVLDRSSPAAVLGRITAPTLLVQGTRDSLFGLGQADANARGIAAAGTPVSVAWYDGGHDQPASDRVTDQLRDDVAGWFDAHLRGRDAAAPPGFRFPVPAGVTAGTGTVQGGTRTESTARYPGLDGDDPARRRAVPLTGPVQPVVTPAGGSPAALTTIPGLGAVSAALAGSTVEVPGQSAVFASDALDAAVEVVGAPTVSLAVSSPTGAATLFAKLYDVTSGSSRTLPAGLVAPLALTGLSTDPAAPTVVPVTLPAIDHRFEAGHRLQVVVSTTDQGYALPSTTSVTTVGLASGTELSAPTVSGSVSATGGSARWWVLLAVVVALGLLGRLAAVLLGRRRRRTEPTAPDGEDVPLRFEGVTKAYKDGFVAVRDLSFEVRRGQVLGLLGPNGAGKTTSLRMLMGLIRPDEGRIEVFGHPAGPGAPVLSRLGSFVEGTGLQPHLTGRDNLTLYWAATGRPLADAHLDEAIEVAGLGAALDRPVRRYSQGMRQRVAIAQAMLGLPDLLVLDEPTNGLDPPQIHAMREVLRSYAETGRTVIVSSHLLAEIEQVCTHVVVMAKGAKIAQGTVEEIVGTGGAVLVGLADDADTDRAAALLAGLPGAGEVQRTDEGLVVDLGPTSRAAAVAALVGAGIGVDRITPRRRLEDAFLSLVGESS
ncbi:alpha/beta fold hydrolase [Modestobacter sp. NPDC049651]|uniref:alpha/beta fold hydrolase n=1 Tax=unclassified Modestobacter TaxID=2643866 RepID=UPI0033E12D91